MSQLFVGISTRSTDPSKITPPIVCTLSSISYEIKVKKSDSFCFVLDLIGPLKHLLSGENFSPLIGGDVALRQRGLNTKAPQSRYAGSSYPPSLSTSAMSCLIEDSISSESSCS